MNETRYESHLFKVKVEFEYKNKQKLSNYNHGYIMKKKCL